MSCKFIRNGLSVIKLFLILVLFQISPAYSSGVQEIARGLTEILRDILFDKRIFKAVVDFDTKGYGKKPHSTTRLKVYFGLANSDRYCVRLDFPHEGAEAIHLNLNEPVHKRSVGFPFRGDDYVRVMEICKTDSLFNKLFYYYDDLYWFRSKYASELKKIKRLNAETGKTLEEFLYDRSHLTLTSKENMTVVSDFTEYFEEAIVSCEGKSIYGNTSDDDSELFQLMLLQDYIFEKTIRLRDFEMASKIGLLKKSDGNGLEKLEEDEVSLLRENIYIKFSDNDELQGVVERNNDLTGLISECLDYLDIAGI